MNEFKTFIKNDDNWEEYKDLINEDTKFMMREEDGTEIEMTSREVINQLYQDNKTLEYYINILQSKINNINQYIKETRENGNSTRLPSGKISDVGYCLDALEDIENIIKDEENE